ncbi:hypothetical protein F383_26960 [Gossypium arboreum]|uniref:Uncharacterized protein n=1 Tax=Gossypium arboreum TaxID=29729 RepID=A0A0B0P3U9_GOSAR|nr:hypothetical protein F383_26960 [Gossypium arboreum]
MKSFCEIVDHKNIIKMKISSLNFWSRNHCSD